MHTPRHMSSILAVGLAGAVCMAIPEIAAARTLRGPRGVIPARATAFAPFGTQRARVRPRSTASLPGSISRLDYQSGPVMHSNRIYTVFWSPSSPPVGVMPISSAYSEEVNTFFKDLVTENGQFDNVYSVATQYSDFTGPGQYSMSFPLGDTKTAIGKYPTPNSCVDSSTEGGTPLPVCVDANQLAERLDETIVSRGWKAGLGSMFFIYTARGVGSCFEAGESSAVATDSCAYSGEKGYCAYHSSFKDSKGEEVIFAYLPYGAVPSCDDGSRPKESDAGPAIDAGSHEQNEAITDPTGSGWWDSAGSEATNADYGFEIGDLCVLAELEAMYGPRLSGSTPYGTEGAFNQLINGNPYLLQREWSDAAGATQGGCVQRLVPAAFAPPSGARATHSAIFDGSGSGTTRDPVVKWSWDFGDATSSSGSSSAVAHVYASRGTYDVVLTVLDGLGNTNTISHSVSVATATAAEEEPVAPVTTVTTGTTPVPPPAATTPVGPPPTRALSASQLAGVLGLPANVTAVSAVGVIGLGHAKCPPACSVAFKLYTTVHITKRHRHLHKRVLIGSLTSTIAPNGSGSLALRLNATGRKLLAQRHKLSAELSATIAGPEGTSWHITRMLTLTSSKRNR